MDSEKIHVKAGFDPVRDVEEFHKKFGLEYVGKPRGLPPEFAQFRQKFIQEELDEYITNHINLEFELGLKEPQKIDKYLEEQLDALVDLVYVALGASHLHGFDFKEAWRRVHAANMAKVRAEKASDSKRGSTFDVVKPAGWTAPSHADLVEDNVYANGNKA